MIREQVMSECITSKRIRNKDRKTYSLIFVEGKLLHEARYLLSQYYKIDYNGAWEAMHLCDNPNCINLEHLMVGTRELNQQDAVNKKRHSESRKTHCPNGHKHTGKKDSRGYRICQECRNNAVKKYRDNRRNS
jgi:hypothetical protein